MFIGGKDFLKTANFKVKKCFLTILMLFYFITIYSKIRFKAAFIRKRKHFEELVQGREFVVENRG